jgi:hypothetical protein
METEERLSWDDVVVVQDGSLGPSDPGAYALMRATDWCSYADQTVIWRGPEKRDEIVKTGEFREVSCTTVLVDEQGFYTCKPTEKPRFYRCPEITEELKDAIEKASEKALDPYAEYNSAQTYSEIEWQEVSERLGDEVFVIAKFGDSLVVNGEIVGSRKKAKPPKGWKKLKEGRYEGMEAEVDVESLVHEVADLASKELGVRIHEKTAERLLRQLYPSGYAYWNSGYGDVEIWVSKENFKAHEGLEKKEAQERYERERVRAAAEMKVEEEKRRQEKEEYRRKVQRGGYPTPRDWSPRGELPGW